MPLSSEALGLLERVAANVPSLRVVNLNGRGIGDDDAKKIADAFRGNTNVTFLNLYNNRIGAEGAKALAKMLQHNSAITELNLNNNGIGDEGAEALAKMLQHNSAITTLYLGHNRIGSEGAKALAKMLLRNSAITTLFLGNNWIGDEGAEALAKMLQHNSAITRLYLGNNGIGDEGAEALAKMLQHNSAITWLGLGNNGIGDSALESKVQRLCEINELSSSPEEAQRRKVAEFGPPPTPTPTRTATQTTAATAAAAAARSEEAARAAEQERRDPELAERLQKEETAAAARAAPAPGATRPVPFVPQAQVQAFTPAPIPPSALAHAPTLTLSRDEQEAVALLARSVGHFERSLEAVRGLPDSVAELCPEAGAYFRAFSKNFERMRVAAQALSSGTVKVQLSSMKDQMLEAVFTTIGDGAAGCGVPFAGLISVVAKVALHQRETRQVNLLHIFEEFFQGDSRDNYLVVYRMLAERICLQTDFSEYSSRDGGRIAEDRRRLGKLLQPIAKRLQSAHLLSLESLHPVEVKAVADLAVLTEGVLRLRLDDRGTFDALKDGDDQEKIRFLLHLLGLDGEACARLGTEPNPSRNRAAASPRRRPGPTTARAAATQPVGGPFPSATDPSAGHSSAARSGPSLEQEVARLRREIERLQARGHQAGAIQRRIRRLEEKVGSERDLHAGGGGGQGLARAQLLRSRNAQSGDRGASFGAAADVESLRAELRDVRALTADIAEQNRARDFDAFVSNRVLQLKEAFQLIEAVLMLAGVDVSATGTFAFNDKTFEIGSTSSRLFRSKRIWKGKTRVKINQVYDGAKSVAYWFEANKLHFVYEKFIEDAIRQVFENELGSGSVSVGGKRATAALKTEQDRDNLFR